jgi:hypothetical protein
MLKPLATIKKLLLIGTAIILFNVPAAAVFADDPAPCSPPPVTDTGVHWPTGADATAFTYQCDGPYAGQWTSAYYVYDPATNAESPLYDRNYSYDCSAQKWYMTDWEYAPAQATYVQSTVPTSVPNGQATGCPVVNPPAAPVVIDPATIDPNKTVDTNGDGILDSPTTSANLALAQANGGVAINLDGTLNTAINNSTTASINNGILSFATTGDALVSGNTTGGSATSGDAVTLSNIINMLQSSSNILSDPNLITFTANINGDVNGDLLLDPAKLGTIQPANSAVTLDNNVTVNNSLDTAINNNITLGANSGDASVTGNTAGGNATTGTADAVANIVNILNSAVTAGSSFMGVININGNLNGDILLPPNFADTLLASNVPHYTVNTANITSNTTVNNTNNQTINNNVDLAAASGNATVSDNTTGGSATSGLADTNLTVFNLTGTDVVASNDILVFVNVLGSWYGMIMNAPAGTTAASLGGGVSSNTTVNNDVTLNNTANQTINNNLNVSAQTGDASVTQNTHGGDATTGDATASANIMNMINDSISLNGWFGLLFINVFGTWNGSFGIDTAAGNPVGGPDGTKGDNSTPMFQFVPVSLNAGAGNSSATYSAGGSGSGGSSDGVVLATSAVQKAAASLPSTVGISAAQRATNHLFLPVAGAVLACLILFAGERRRFFGRN